MLIHSFYIQIQCHQKKLTCLYQIFQIGNQQNGYGPVEFSWSKDSSHLATVGSSLVVFVYDRRGKKLKEFNLPTKKRVQILDWDFQGQYLAILQQGLSFVTLWNVWASANGIQVQLDKPKSKATFIKWSITHPMLAIGTDSGCVIFYNKKNHKKIPTIGKHGKKIISGDWNNQGLLVTGSQDKIITISNFNGDTQYQSFAAKSQPSSLKWAAPKTDQRNTPQKAICAILNRKTLLMYDLNQQNKKPLQLMFESKYGKINDYRLFGDGYIVLAFSEGWFSYISTHNKQLSKKQQLEDQVKSQRCFNAPLQGFTTNDCTYKMAIAGQNKIKIYSAGSWKQNKNQSYDIPKNIGKICGMEWSNNGQTLVVSTQAGFIIGLMTSTPSITATYNQLVAIVSSFTQITIISALAKNNQLCSIQIQQQPTNIAIGPKHVAVQMNNLIGIFRWLTDDNKIINGGDIVNQKQYSGDIKKILINQEYLAVLTDNKVFLASLQGKNEIKDKKFPQDNKSIINIGMTKHFLIMIDMNGKIQYYNIQDQLMVMQSQSDFNNVKVFPNKLGTKIICIDNKGEGYLFQSASQNFTKISEFPAKANNVIWDLQNPNQFIVAQGQKYRNFIINKNSINGNCVNIIKQYLSVQSTLKQLEIQSDNGQPVVTFIQKSYKPLTLINGLLSCFSTYGTIVVISLTSHSYLSNYKFAMDNQEGHLKYFFQNIALKRFKNCLIAAQYLENDQVYEVLGMKALQNLQIQFAFQAYHLSKNIAMVLMLKNFLQDTQRNLMIGNCAMLLGKYDLAQQYYLKSSEPLNALDLRCDVQDWVVALNLAKNIAPEQQSFICKRLGAKIEAQGNNSQALKLYQRAQIMTNKEKLGLQKVQKHNAQCMAGIARSCIKLGDVQRGYKTALQIKQHNLLNDIAIVCENMKQSYQAAQLYQKAMNYQKAVSHYLNLRMFKQAAPLMEKIKSPKILLQYGKAKEIQKNYKQAEDIYFKAEAWEDAVRLNLNHLDNFQKAKKIVKEKCSTTSVASMVAKYCQNRGMNKQAIQFLLLANRKEQAFVIAQSHNEMQVYALLVKDSGTQQRIVIAQYFQGKGMWQKAAKQYQLAQNPMKALKLYMKAGQNFIQMMIQLVQTHIKQQTLFQTLLDYLMGQIDNKPKDPLYTYKLYRAVKNYKGAAKIAITIASQSQQNGSYKQARDILFQTYQDIRNVKFAVPLELQRRLLIVHSYILVVKRIIKLKEHQDAALLLNRIAKNLAQFPAHAVNILTSAVVESMRANFKGMAYQWSIVLYRPQYRSNISEQYKSKIENIARRRVTEENPQKKSPCPFCGQLIYQFDVDCMRCQNFLPFCMASGKYHIFIRHLLAKEFCVCPFCNFPANINYLKKVLQAFGECPMCERGLKVQQVKFIGESGVNNLKFKKIQKQQQQK